MTTVVIVYTITRGQNEMPPGIGTPTTRKNETPRFDPAVLQTLQEPFTARVEKVRGAHSQPIQLPAKEGFGHGFGLTREEVTRLENWLVTDFTGGGLYHFTIVDAAGSKMEWYSYYDPRQFPERVPPDLQTAFVPQNANNQQAATMGQNPNVPSPMYPPIGTNTSAYPPPGSSLYGQQLGASPPAPPWSYSQQPQQQQGASTPAPNSGYGTPTPVFGGYRRYGFDMEDDYDHRRRNREDPEKREMERREQMRLEMERREEERRKYDVELKRREDDLRRLEAEKRESEHKAQLERLEQDHARQMEALKQEIRSIGEVRSQAENVEARREREARETAERQARETREAAERDRERVERERERERSDARFKEIQDTIAKVAEKHRPEEDARTRALEEEIRRTREEAQRERERMERERDTERMRQEMKENRERTEALLHEAKASRPDPLIEIMKENARIQSDNARAQAETVKEVARLQQMSTDRMSNMMMTPQAMVSLLKDTSSGTDALVKNMTGAMGSIFDVMKNAVMAVSGLTNAPGEPLAARLIQEGLGRASEMAEKYIGYANNKSQGENQVKMHQAEAARATALAQAEAARVRAAELAAVAAAARAANPPPPSSKNGNGATLAGAEPPPPQPAVPGKPRTQASAPLTNDDGKVDAQTGATIPKPPTPKAKMEQDMFGPAMQSVEHLRIGVQLFLDNLTQNPPQLDEKGDPIGLTPDKAVDAILEGVNRLNAMRLTVPAFEMFKEGRYADFIDLIIPQATQPYKEECVQILTKEVTMTIPGEKEVTPVAIPPAMMNDDVEDGDDGDDAVVN